MKTGALKEKIKSRVFNILAISLFSLFYSHDVSPQSGRPVPKLQTPSPESPTLPVPKPKFVPDPKADKYKLVFPTIIDDRPLYPPKKGKDPEYPIYTKRANFIEELNKIGAQGYRLLFADDAQEFIGIAQLGDVQYEYAWFRTATPYPDSKGNFEEQYNALARKGFVFVSDILGNRYCPSNDDGTINFGCDYTDYFIFERRSEDVPPKTFRVVYQSRTFRRKKIETEMTAKLQFNLDLELYPISLFSKFEVLLQEGRNNFNLSADKSELKLIAGGKLSKEVNLLAQQGYRLALVESDAALMFRQKGEAIQTSYVWLDVGSKNFESQLKNEQETGGIFRMGHRYALIFEHPIKSDGLRREYRVLQFGLQITEDFARQKRYVALGPAAKENEETMHRLVKEGYEVRALFGPDYRNKSSDIRVLLERIL